MTLYHISTNDKLEKMWYPRIPHNKFTEIGYEDVKIPRICVAPTISDCITALWPTPDGAISDVNKDNIPSEYYVYIPTGNYSVVKPTTKQVPDSKFTNEHWITSKCKFMLVSKISVDIDKKKISGKLKLTKKIKDSYDFDCEYLLFFKFPYKVIKHYNKISTESCVYLW